jgi:S1-C subfamily serine protease
MKHFPMFGSLVAMIVGGLLTPYPGWATGGSVSFSGELGPDFLMYSAQGYLGVNLSEVDTDRITALHLKDAHGAEVTLVDHDAPAGKSGLKVHDVILQLDGQPVENAEQLRHRLLDMPSGRTVSFLVNRDGAPLTINVQLCDREELEHKAWPRHKTVPEPAPPTRSGFSQTFVGRPSTAVTGILDTVMPKGLYVGAELNPVRTQLADYFGVSSGTGLLVENVDYQSPAARAGLKAGDVVVKVESQQMTSKGDWVKAIRNHRGHLVQVTVMRNKQEQVLTMSAGKLKNK